jgi:two-component system alkaline phosphatase synthesis response regulator PhoP
MTPSGRILMVDDDRDFAEALGTLLRRHGYEVLWASDGREGVLRARRDAPDLILVDVMMDERTEGFFVVQELRRIPELQGVPIFVVSAVYQQAPEFQVAPDRRWLAHDAFFPKPVDTDALLARIRETLAVPRPAAAREVTP